MKGIYVIAIAFLALLIEIAAREYRPIPTKCFLPPDNETVHLAHEYDCTKFYKCPFLSEKYVQLCPLMIKGDPYTRLHFNRLLQVCDWPWQAGCIHCPRDNGHWPSVKLPHETDNCRSYYLCVNGEKHIQYCPANTCFSRTCQECVVNRQGGRCDGSGIPSKDCYNPFLRNGDKESHHCDCNMYYECVDGDRVPRNCQPGFHFNPRLKICTTPDKAECPLPGY